jgi:hypothetical protein
MLGGPGSRGLSPPAVSARSELCAGSPLTIGPPGGSRPALGRDHFLAATVELRMDVPVVLGSSWASLTTSSSASVTWKHHGSRKSALNSLGQRGIRFPWTAEPLRDDELLHTRLPARLCSYPHLRRTLGPRPIVPSVSRRALRRPLGRAIAEGGLGIGSAYNTVRSRFDAIVEAVGGTAEFEPGVDVGPEEILTKLGDIELTRSQSRE